MLYEEFSMYATRQRMEELEVQTLAPYGLRSGASRGRQHHEGEPKYRTAFQRDRDRIIHSAAFRRLEYKTQVFVNDEGDYYRTRLTHTLEVAQIGRTLARALGVNEDLVEAICLAHDLGHPPFGHAGEGVLNTLTQACGGFNHNHQSYRVVTQLERRYPDWPGLNLTYEALEGIAKHETEYDLSNVTGYDAARKGSLEAQIANVSDELAYNAHDLDDGLAGGLIAVEDLQEVALWRRVAEQTRWGGGRLDEITRHTLIREWVGLQVDDVLNTTTQRLNALKPASSDAVQLHSEQIVSHSDELKAANRQAKDFLFEHMYVHFRVVRMLRRAEQFVTELFNRFVRDPRQLPPEYQGQLNDKDMQRVVADYIAAMTDRGALLEYRRLFDPLMKP
jgi:dGTPase